MTCGPSWRCRAARLFSKKWTSRIARRLAHAEQTMRVRIARDELRRARELTHTINALEIEIAGADRFATDAKLARAAAVAPIPVSSAKTNRHRLDRGGNRQVNTAIHRVAITRLRCHAETQDYIARKRAEGKSTRGAIRCLKRHLARPSGTCSSRPTPDRDSHTHQFLDIDGMCPGLSCPTGRDLLSSCAELVRAGVSDRGA
jgi:transposase IS116/IS110/IS902 family protein